jgi:prolyl oligopeptidase PreP (S9A serine peptidase family)
MEELDSEEVKEFVDAQAAVVNTVLSTCEHSGRLRGQLTALFNHPRFRAPFKRRGSYFYFHNPGLQPHNTLFVQVRISYAHSFFCKVGRVFILQNYYMVHRWGAVREPV